MLLYAALTAAILPHSIAAQETKRDLGGTVTDGHEPLRGAVVQLEDETTHAIVSYITGRTGQYSFKRIGGDTDYQVWATFRGTRSKQKQLDRFNTSKTPTIDLVIELR
jgi:hypothetical protein